MSHGASTVPTLIRRLRSQNRLGVNEGRQVVYFLPSRSLALASACCASADLPIPEYAIAKELKTSAFFGWVFDSASRDCAASAKLPLAICALAKPSCASTLSDCTSNAASN